MVLIHRPMMSSSSSHVCDEATDAHSRVVDVAVVALKNLKVKNASENDCPSCDVMKITKKSTDISCIMHC